MTAADCLSPPTYSPPRAEGSVTLSIGAEGRLKRLRQSASLKVLFPRVDGSACHAVLVNTAGGATGGDQFKADASVHDGGHLVLTTQAAERAYQAQPGQVAHVRNRLFVGGGSRLDWLPQEMLLFNGSAIDRSLSVELAQDAELTLVETLVFGRTAMGETVREISLKDRIDIRRDGTPLLLDQIRLHGDAAAHLAGPFRADGQCAMSLVVVISPRAEALLDPVRALLPKTGGASLRDPDMLVARILGRDSFVLRQSLVPILSRICGDVPKPWKI